MSGILGLWNRAGQPLNRDEVNNACSLLSHLGRSQVTAEAHWAVVEFKDSFVKRPTAPHPRFAVAFDGRLDDKLELDETPSATLARLLDKSDGELPKLAGDFAVAAFDRKHQVLSLARDPVGCRPLYYAEVGNRFIFSSEVKALLGFLGNLSRPNESSLRDWFSTAFSVLENTSQTPFTGVFAVPPGQRVRVTREAVSLRIYDELGSFSPEVPENFPEAVEQFRWLFQQAVKRRCRNERVGVSVSGGLDSSSIYVATAHEGANPIGIAMEGAHDGNESKYLNLLEKQVGKPIRRVSIEASPRDFIEELRQSVWHSEFPLVDYLGHAQAELYSTLQSEGATVVLSGHWADELMHTPAYLVDLFLGGKWFTLAKHLGRLSEWFTPEESSGLKRRFVAEASRSLVPPAVAAALKPLRLLCDTRRSSSGISTKLVQRPLEESWKLAFRGPLASCHANDIYLSLRSRIHLRTREWFSKSAARFGLRCEFPFLDRDLVEFLLAMKGVQKNHDGVPRALLREAMKDLLPVEIARRNWKTSYRDLGERTLRANESLLRSVLQGRRCAVNLGLLQSEPRPPSLGELAELCGLEMWCSSFFGGVK